MHIKCPSCGAVASLDLLIAAEDGATEVVQYVGELEPKTYRLVMQYLTLFRPRKTKLSWARVASLLAELVPMIKAAEFSRGGIKFNAPLPYWEAGIEEMLSRRDRFTSPLKNHGYLLEVMMSIDVKAKGVAEKAEPSKKPAVETHHDPPDRKEEPPVEPQKPLSEEGKKAKAEFFLALGKLTGKTRPQYTPEEAEARREQQAKQLLEAAEIKQRMKEESENHDSHSNT